MSRIHYGLYVDMNGTSLMTFLGGYHRRQAVFAERAFRKTVGKHVLLVAFDDGFMGKFPPSGVSAAELLACYRKVSEKIATGPDKEYSGADAALRGAFREDALNLPDIQAARHEERGSSTNKRF